MFCARGKWSNFPRELQFYDKNNMNFCGGEGLGALYLCENKFSHFSLGLTESAAEDIKEITGVRVCQGTHTGVSYVTKQRQNDIPFSSNSLEALWKSPHGFTS